MDTTNILGRGTVKDTYNLLANGIAQLVRALAEAEGTGAEAWGPRQGLEGHLSPSIKGCANVDCDDEEARRAFLHGIVTDAERLLRLAGEAKAQKPEEDEQGERLRRAGALLGQLISQDVERSEEGSTLKEGVARDRIVSAHDPEMRYGRKSKSKRFDGHKAAIAVDAESQLITAVGVLAATRLTVSKPWS